MIVALCGLQGSGKDTLAGMLVGEHGFVQVSFAGALKDVCAVLFGWDRDLLEGATPASRAWREEEDVWWAERLGRPGLTPRQVLQEFGTDVVRQHWHDQMWVACMERRLDALQGQRIVITDCRFPNEIDLLRRKSAVVVHVQRGSLPVWYHAYRQDHIQEVPDLHKSEWAWTRSAFDHTILNDGTLKDLQNAAANLLAITSSHSIS